ncbi:MAG: hypothetical protein WCI03_01640 [bacterium]
MGVLKCVSLVIVIGLLSFVSGVQAQELAQNIQAPATAPVVEPAPVTPVAVPVVTETVPAYVTTNIPLHQTAAAVVHIATNMPAHGATNGTAHVATNAAVVPVTHVVEAHTNVVIAPATEEMVITEGDQFFVDTWKHPSFQVGTRSLQVKLSDTTRGTPMNGSFFGTITEISEVQDNSPDKVFIQARLPHTPIWLGVSYDHVTARTMDDINGDGVPDAAGGDGDEEIKGFVPYVQAAWDNETRFTPYAQVGYAFYQADFIPNSWGDNGHRWVDATSSVHGFELGGGLGVRLYKNLSADLFAKTVKVDDITGEWHGHGASGGPFVMTMSYVAYGAGLSCRF